MKKAARTTKIKPLTDDYSLSLVDPAPDHEKPELALRRRRGKETRYAVMAVGEEAGRLFAEVDDLERARELAREYGGVEL